MGCGHVFCNDCWSQHCKVQIKDGRSRKLPCMGVKCGAACDEEKVVIHPHVDEKCYGPLRAPTLTLVNG